MESPTGDKSAFHVIATPGNLQNVAAASLDEIISQSIRLLGPVPYSGGDMVLQMGLFSVAEQDLAKPFLDVLQTLSESATTSFISVALPFISPLEKGVSELIGDSNSGLEIGLYKAFDAPTAPKTGYYAVIKTPLGSLDVSKLRVDNYQRLVDDASGTVIPYPYLLFSIERSATRDDWREIPAVQTHYKALLDAESTGDASKISDALAAFRLSVAASPDLLPHDKTSIIADPVSGASEPAGSCSE